MKCFKAYDVRGPFGDELTLDFAQRLGRAFALVLGAKDVVVGRDIRASSPELSAALIAGLRSAGCDVDDIGLCGTEEVYFATDHLGACGGIMVTASHNPKDHNGFKLVGAGSKPLEQAVFEAVKNATVQGVRASDTEGRHRRISTRDAYLTKVCGFAEARKLGPLHLLVNSGHGCAGPVFDAILEHLTAKGARLKVTRVHHAPDPAFPAGVPNPLIAENQPQTGDAVRQAGADLGIAWDSDFDRCFFFDETGAFVPGEHVVGLLAEAILQQEPGARIVHDIRVVNSIRHSVRSGGGHPVASRTGHAFMKSKMRELEAVYGGEMSAHHYFRDFMYCDSGMIPWILLVQRLSDTGVPLSELVAERRKDFPSSGEINFRIDDPEKAMRWVERELRSLCIETSQLDGLSMDFGDWQFNLRPSNTESMLRLNVEGANASVDIAAHVAALRKLLDRI